ncbi:DUF362 domain-containing protein [candidate division KSB1 bacterium]|nr:DUF362 domain-containing protein [candidate division KSB1 bacterium]
MKFKQFLSRIMLPLIGIASLIWFLVRVIPKPSRAGYPCMRVAFPLASTFVTYMLSLAATLFAFKHMKTLFYENRYKMAGLFMLIGLIAGSWFLSHTESSLANNKISYTTDFPANEPMGTGTGIFPGRVVWSWNPGATVENQTRMDDNDAIVSENDSYYFLAKNNDQSVIDKMTDDLVLKLTGEKTVANAWQALFKFHNMKKTGTESSYTPGEIIFIKINATSITQGDGGKPWCTFDPTELSKMRANWQTFDNENNVPDIVETSPQVVLAVVRHLVDQAGVRQQDITIGDPMKNVYKHMFDYIKTDYPDVNILGNDMFYNGLDLAALDRVPVAPTENDVIFYSDKGAQLDEAISDKLYTIHQDASYMINIASLKAHACAGITLCAKNHFGSQSRATAGHLHKGLVCEENDKPVRNGYGYYRPQVDLMAHEMLGGNTMLFMVDGLYSAIEGWTGAKPVKWQMAPFNNDYTNSIIASLDPVALESVCFDLLRTEYDGPETETNRPNMTGVDEYLRHAADPSTWPEGIVYDPENDGKPIASLGVYEHWNNEFDMQYSRDLGGEEGIELIKAFGTSTSMSENQESGQIAEFHLFENYPNPFNDATVIGLTLEEPARVRLDIYDINGRRVNTILDEHKNMGYHIARWNGTDHQGMSVSSGVYLYRVTIRNTDKSFTETKRMLLVK